MIAPKNNENKIPQNIEKENKTPSNQEKKKETLTQIIKDNKIINNNQNEILKNEANDESISSKEEENKNSKKNKKEISPHGNKEIKDNKEIKTNEDSKEIKEIKEIKEQKANKEKAETKNKKENKETNLKEDNKETKIIEDNKKNKETNEIKENKENKDNKENQTNINKSESLQKQEKSNIQENNNIKNEKAEKAKFSLSLPQKENQKESEQPFNKELCKSIASSLPKRKATNYPSLKETMKSKTEKLSEKEKSYIIFLWICDNISYDVDSYFAGRDVDCTPEGVFKNGSSVCSGYARLYKDISNFLNLKVECINCYAKGVSYKVGQKMQSSNHEYNAIKLNNNWYPIDSTWGAGHVEGKKFIKSYNEFYFLANPELLIKTHFPVNEQWQLTKKKKFFR